MRRTTMVFVAAVILVVGGQGGRLAAQDTKSARGTVTALGADSVTVKAGTQDLVLTVDPKTVLTASGAGTADRRAEAAGKGGPRLADFVKVGDAVEVGYQEVGGKMRAASIRKVGSAGAGSSAEDRAMTSSGTVASVTGTTFTVSGNSGGGASFTQSFTVTRETTVVAVGAGTASAKSGGIAFTAAVGVGDQVSVSYRKVGEALHAESVRVTAKKK